MGDDACDLGQESLGMIPKVIKQERTLLLSINSKLGTVKNEEFSIYEYKNCDFMACLSKTLSFDLDE